MKTLLFSLVLILISTISIQAQKESYYMSKTIPVSLDKATEMVKNVLKKEHFGVVSENNMDESLNKKLPENEKLKPLRILGVCNHDIAIKVLKIDQNVAIFMPCKVLLKSIDENTTEVVFMDPKGAMVAVHNQKLDPILDEVTEMLEKAFDNLK